MKRRGFLQALLGIAGTTALPASSSTNKNINMTKPVKLLQTSIAGFQYYKGEDLFNHIKIGDTVQLRRAPNNKYDKRAVEVYWKGNMLGHIPRLANMGISQMLDDGVKLEGEVVRLNPEKVPFYCAEFAVFVNSNK